MKAIVYTKFGSPDVLQLIDVEKPVDLAFEEAAAVPMAALKALQGLRDKRRIPAMRLTFK